MASMTVPALNPQPNQVTMVVGGVDTHKDLHVAAVVTGDGTMLGTESFSTTRAGYRALLRWMRSFGDLRRVGIEGTSSYGAGLTRHLAEAAVEVLDATGPTAPIGGGAANPTRSMQSVRRWRRWLVGGPASRSRAAGWNPFECSSSPGPPRSGPAPRPCSCCGITSSLLPRSLRDQVRNLTRMQLIRACAAWRPDTVGYWDPVVATRVSLKSLARRILDLNDEIADLDALIEPLVRELAPQLLASCCIGIETAGAAAGDSRR
jgi:transposase